MVIFFDDPDLDPGLWNATVYGTHRESRENF
jgi:hypothetical protein